MPNCDACKAEFEDLFIVEDGTKLCARCLEMEAFEKIATESSHATVVLDQDDD